jgi:hypothetical protein
MALDQDALAPKVVAFFRHKRWRKENLVNILREFFRELFEHIQAELEITNLAKAWDNFDKDDLNLQTFTVGTSRTSAQTAYSVGATSDEVVLQDTGVGIGSNYAHLLPGTPLTGQRVTIKDTSGNANNRNIVINGNGNNIDGAGSVSITASYGAARLLFDGSNWFII